MKDIYENYVIGQFEYVSQEVYKKSVENAMSPLELEDITKPKRSTKWSAGYDLFTPFDIYLNPNESIVIPTGMKCMINPCWCLLILPRSGHGFMTGVRLCNTVGVIDADYYNNEKNEGHIMVKLENNSALNETLYIPKGHAFCQGLFVPYGITYDDIDIGKQERNGGFGSTGK